MSKQGIEQLIGKAFADKGFLEDLLKNPEAKIKDSGLEISAEEIAEIKKVDHSKAKRFAESFSKEFASRLQPGMSGF